MRLSALSDWVAPLIPPGWRNAASRRALETFVARHRAEFEAPKNVALRSTWWRRDAALARDFAAAGAIAGTCRFCDRPSHFTFTPAEQPDWRESLHCAHCALISRIRFALAIVEAHGGLDRHRRLYATEQATPLYRVLRNRGYAITGSEYVTDPQRRALLDGYVREITEGRDAALHVEDVTRLSYADASFDVAMSFDVLEHVPDFRAAFAELRRVLVPGGLLAVSVPFDVHADATLVRASLRSDGSIEHHVEPEYHGDPASDAGCLAFYTYGWSLLDDVRAAGFDDVHGCFGRSATGAMLGLQLCILGTARPP